MNITQESIIGEIVKINYKTASLFEANHIDYCCSGEVTLSEACTRAGVDSNQLISQLDVMLGQDDPDAHYFNTMSLDDLCNYIVRRHHSYVRESIPFLRKNLEKLYQVHGNDHLELLNVIELFNNSADNLIKHMQKEEIVLFPYIVKLVLAVENNTQPVTAPFGSVANPIGMMMADHHDEGDRFSEISKLTQQYKYPADACATFMVTYSKLKDFENDLYRHIHLENNVLFPKAILMEKGFRKNN